MPRKGRFKPGQSGNPKTQFKAGNPHRWQPGQSGNPAGVARSRLEFQKQFYEALLAKGSPEEAASLLWEAACDREPWAIQLYLQRVAPETKQINVNQGFQDEELDLERLSDEDLTALEQIAERAKDPTGSNQDGAGTSHL